MTNAKSTKRALFTSALAVLMCVAMLIGTTFAWFTDSASTGVNKIQAGNLKMEVSYKNTADGEFKILNEKTNVFKEDTLWEPGHVEYAVLNVKNVGTLALKYKLGINIVSETGSTNVNGKDFKLSDYIKFAVIDGEADVADRAALVTAAEAADSKLINEGYSKESHLDTTDANETVTLVVWMPESVGNDANYAAGAAVPEINLGIGVYATQYTYEKDSFGDDYDANATYYPVIDAAGLKDALKVGGSIDVENDLDIGQTMVAEKATTINMNGKTVANSKDIWNNNTENWSLISAQKGADLTVTGNGTFKAKENDCYAVDVQDGATITIENGTFVGNIHAVYVMEGTAYIKGGFYSVQQKYPKDGLEDEFVLNCLDENRENGTAKIIVTGGTFVNFNPADCYAEGAHTNFVENGYDVISETQANGDVWYTVVKGTGAVVGTQEELNTAIGNNSNVTVKLTEARTYSLPEMTDKEVSIIGTKDTVIDMKNKINKAQSLSFKGVTVNFGTDDYYGFQHTGKLTYEDCTITGKQFLYGNEVEFNNCVFEQDVVDYNVWTYGAGRVLFNNCTFNCAGKSVLIYNEGSISGQTVEFQNCKFNASAPAAGKAAIEIDSSLLKNGATYKVIIDKATADSVTGFGVGTNSGSSVWNDKKGSSATVVVDGKTVLSAN